MQIIIRCCFLCTRYVHTRYFILSSTQDLRKGLSPTFSSGKIKGMLDLLDGGVNQMIDHLDEVTKKDSVVDIKDVFQKMALDVIARSLIATITINQMKFCRCAFGIDSNSFTNPDNKMLGSGRNIFEEFILRDSLSTGAFCVNVLRETWNSTVLALLASCARQPQI